MPDQTTHHLENPSWTNRKDWSSNTIRTRIGMHTRKQLRLNEDEDWTRKQNAGVYIWGKGTIEDDEKKCVFEDFLYRFFNWPM